MNIHQRHLTDAELAAYFRQTGSESSAVDDNDRILALIAQQADPRHGYPRLIRNLKTYQQGTAVELTVQSIPLRLMLNVTRTQSLTANTFEQPDVKMPANECFLCNLDIGQRGVLIQDNRFMVLTNPGITLPGDLTIAAVKHAPQTIRGRFQEMTEVASNLYGFSIFFNGALAGASSPHFHFQAGYREGLPAETQFRQLVASKSGGDAQLKNIFRNDQLEVYSVENYLRPVHLVVAREATELVRFLDYYLTRLTTVSKELKGLPNVPDFGDWVASLQQPEKEARLNIMLKYYPDRQEFLGALFPKQFNRPQCYFARGAQQIILGMAIKEALGNLITCRESDFNRLRDNPQLIAQAYRDTALPPQILITCTAMLTEFC